MKRTFIFSATAIFSLFLILSSCKSSRVWETKDREDRIVRTSPPPPPNRQYWKGHDNRFYLDRSYLNRVSYSKWEYNDWKRYKKAASQKRR